MRQSQKCFNKLIMEVDKILSSLSVGGDEEEAVEGVKDEKTEL